MKRHIDFIAITTGIIGLILFLAYLGVAWYVVWMVIKALQKYLAS